MLHNKRYIYYLQSLLCLIPLLFMGLGTIEAQTRTISLHLVDAETQSPISYAHFSIENQKGISDEQGTIKFEQVENASLSISHILYGNVSIAPNKLNEVSKLGSVQLKQLEITLQPAVVMGLHSQKHSNEMLEINYQDLLTHDAGAFLEQSAAISSIKKSGSYGFDPVFRGFKYDQLNIIIDGGQAASAACPNRMDPPASQVSLNMMGSVEIYKGPHSLRYGNSFGGTFHFISPEPEFTNKLHAFGRASTSYESNGDIKRIEAMGGTSMKKFNMKLFGSHSTGTDYTDGEGQKIPANFARTSMGGNIDLKLTEKQNLSLSVNNNIAKDVDFPSLAMDLRKDNTLLVNLRHKIELKQTGLNSIATMVYGSFVDHEMDNLLKNLNPRMVNAITTATTKTYGGRTEGRINFGSGWAFIGADLRINEQNGERTRDMLMGPMAGKTFIDNVWQDGIMQRVGGFGEIHLNLSAYHLVAALRLDANTSEIRNPADEFVAENANTSQNQINTSASIGATHTITNSTSLGLWLGRAKRSGSLTELYINYFPVGLDSYEMLGNPDLKPEVNNQADINLKWISKSAVLNINVFASYLTDYISSEIDTNLSPRLPQSQKVRRFTNIDQTLMTGFEASWQQELIWHIKHRLSIAYTFAEDIKTNKPLPEIPPMEFKYVLSGSYFKDKIKPEVSIKHALEQNRISESFGETPTSEFTVVDIKASYNFNTKVILALGIQNLFNQTYYEHLSRAMKIENGRPLYAPGRNYFATLTAKF